MDIHIAKTVVDLRGQLSMKLQALLRSASGAPKPLGFTAWLCLSVSSPVTSESNARIRVSRIS